MRLRRLFEPVNDSVRLGVLAFTTLATIWIILKIPVTEFFFQDLFWTLGTILLVFAIPTFILGSEKG
jgi:hypothetical protein